MKREQDNLKLDNMLKSSEARCKKLEDVLKVIHIWARNDDLSPHSREKVMSDIVKRSEAVLFPPNIESNHGEADSPKSTTTK